MPRAPLLSLLLLVGACRAPSIPHPARGECQPACPGAATAPLPDVSVVLRALEAQPAPALRPEAERAPSSAAYLCPMHLHIGSDHPGRCPECGMELVPRVQALVHDHDR